MYASIIMNDDKYSFSVSRLFIVSVILIPHISTISTGLVGVLSFWDVRLPLGFPEPRPTSLSILQISLRLFPSGLLCEEPIDEALYKRVGKSVVLSL